MKWINKSLLCSMLFLGMSTQVLADVEDSSQTMDSSSTQMTLEETQTSSTKEISETSEESSTPVELESTTSESSLEDSATTVESSTQAEEIEEEVDYGFGIPNGRSDLEASPVAFSSRANNIFSITDKNLPKSNFIDVSSHNGNISVAEYRKMKSYGVTGVVVKVSEATSYTNPYAKDQIKNAQEAGLKVSAYHYSWFTTEQAAREEARYFASFVAKLGLPKSTVMINDIEEPKIMGNKNHTKNSKAFAQELNNQGYKDVKHYVGLHWIRDNRIDTQALGDKNIWVAAYPYTPSVQQHTQYGAWQWTDSMTFPGVSGKFDMSSDYAGFYSNLGGNLQGPYIADGRYVTVSSKGYDVFSNFNWKVKTTSNALYQKTYKAKGRYKHADGLTYYSIYDNKDVWQGYINSNAVKVAEGPQGVYIKDGSFVKVTAPNDIAYNDFKGTYRNSTKNMLNKIYEARGRYNTFEGLTYLSLYDKEGKWQGYVKESATVKDTGAGKYISDGRFVTITSTNYNIFSNFNWKVKNTSKNVFQKTYQAKGRYEHANGSTYYSLYDGDGVWQGYINAKATTVADGRQGMYLSYGKKVEIINGNYTVYQNFSWKYKNSGKNLMSEKLVARGRYNHINGSTYLSLYDSKGQWQGYINQQATRIVN